MSKGSIYEKLKRRIEWERKFKGRETKGAKVLLIGTIEEKGMILLHKGGDNWTFPSLIELHLVVLLSTPNLSLPT